MSLPVRRNGETSWKKHHGRNIMEETSWKKHHGRNIMEETSWRNIETQ
jgi:hypothetical protein